MREVDEVQCTNIAQKSWFKGEEMIFSHPPQLLTRESSIKTFSVFLLLTILCLRSIQITPSHS